MQRWNGWGDDSVTYPLPQAALGFLAEVVGPATPPQDASLEHVISSLPASRLPQHPLVAVEPETRLATPGVTACPTGLPCAVGTSPSFLTGSLTPLTRARCATCCAMRARLEPN